MGDKPSLLINEIGRLVDGIDYSAMSQAGKRLRVKLEHEAKLKKKFDRLTGYVIRLSRGKICPPPLILEKIESKAELFQRGSLLAYPLLACNHIDKNRN